MQNKSRVTLFLFLSIFIFTSGTIDLNNLFNYANQSKPAYIVKDNTPGSNAITDAGATLGRVLFYDKKLSVNGTLACASCHKQEFAFGDTATQSVGLNSGLTGRHSMRLVNSRFADEVRFFWDERATSLENQTTQPIQDHIEMGFSGTNGDPDLDSLIRRLEKISYYQQLFQLAFGSTQINEAKIQNALSQFIRSIQSFDSKFDVGRSQAPNMNAPFANFTADENAGKQLFLAPPNTGGAGCQGCHRGPEFDIDPNSRNNGVIAVAGNQTTVDLSNTRAPSLRDLFNNNGVLNGPLMHNGAFKTIEQVIEHYNLVPNNNSLDQRLRGPGGNLQLTAQEKSQLIAFLRTLSGRSIYTDTKWSDPFDVDGNISLTPTSAAVSFKKELEAFTMYPNPAKEYINLSLPEGNFNLQIFSLDGKILLNSNVHHSSQINIAHLNSGVYLVRAIDSENKKQFTSKLIKP